MDACCTPDKSLVDPEHVTPLAFLLILDSSTKHSSFLFLFVTSAIGSSCAGSVWVFFGSTLSPCCSNAFTYLVQVIFRRSTHFVSSSAASRTVVLERVLPRSPDGWNKQQSPRRCVNVIWVCCVQPQGSRSNRQGARSKRRCVAVFPSPLHRKQ